MLFQLKKIPNIELSSYLFISEQHISANLHLALFFFLYIYATIAFQSLDKHIFGFPLTHLDLKAFAANTPWAASVCMCVKNLIFSKASLYNCAVILFVFNRISFFLYFGCQHNFTNLFSLQSYLDFNAFGYNFVRF